MCSSRFHAFMPMKYCFNLLSCTWQSLWFFINFIKLFSHLVDSCEAESKWLFSVFSRIRYCPHFVHLSVCLLCYYFAWGWPNGAIYGSIDSLWPRTPITFFGPGGGRIWSSISFEFHIKIGFYWYLRRTMRILLDWEGGGPTGVWKYAWNTRENTTLQWRLP